MTAEQDGLNPVKVKALHEGAHDCSGVYRVTAGDLSCVPYRLAALALDLQGKVARIEAQAERWESSRSYPAFGRTIRAALADQPERAIGRARLVDWCRYCGAIEPEHLEDCRTLTDQPEQE